MRQRTHKRLVVDYLSRTDAQVIAAGNIVSVRDGVLSDVARASPKMHKLIMRVRRMRECAENRLDHAV